MTIAIKTPNKSVAKLLLLILAFLCQQSYSMSSSIETVKPLEEDQDRLLRWKGRWDELKLGWHQDKPHAILLNHGDKVLDPESCPSSANGLRWFVPLCGKTVDMAYLLKIASTAEVVGVDGIRRALEEFAKDHPDLELAFDPSSSAGSTHKRFTSKSKPITLLKGDYFALNETITGGRFDAVLDRGSLVAIDPTLREEYLETMKRVLKPGGKIMLVTLDKRSGDEEARKRGPPYSINEADVRALYEGKDWVKSVTLLGEIDEFEADPDPENRFRQEGITSMFELHFLIEANQ